MSRSLSDLPRRGTATNAIVLLVFLFRARAKKFGRNRSSFMIFSTRLLVAGETGRCLDRTWDTVVVLPPRRGDVADGDDITGGAPRLGSWDAVFSHAACR
jgi:hypothetical protein